MVMMLFGGMSRGERTRVQVRTKAAMQDWRRALTAFWAAGHPTDTNSRTQVPTPTLAGQRRVSVLIA